MTENKKKSTEIEDDYGNIIFEGDLVLIKGDGYLDIGAASFDDVWAFKGIVKFHHAAFWVVSDDGIWFALGHYWDDSVVGIEKLEGPKK